MQELPPQPLSRCEAAHHGIIPFLKNRATPSGIGMGKKIDFAQQLDEVTHNAPRQTTHVHDARQAFQKDVGHSEII